MSESRRILDQVIPILISWLEPSDPEMILAITSKWSSRIWAMAPVAIFSQGIGPYLFAKLSETQQLDKFPVHFRDILAREYTMNNLRIARMHSEVHSLLHNANKAGISVMPLKGSLLTLQRYYEPALRPMADIDLLVKSNDRHGMAEILHKQGYEYLQPENPYSKHDRFIHKDAQVVSWDGEHPDNPRPVEIHTEVRRRLWGDVGSFDLSKMLWDGSEPKNIFSEQVWVPREESLLIHLCTHAIENLLVGSSRVIQFIDLAYVAPRVRNIGLLAYPEYLYPTLRLTQRALPSQLHSIDLHGLYRKVHPYLITWSDQVPLNSRCGLATHTRPTSYNRWRKRWNRWRPSPWRLIIGYGNIPIYQAYGRHLLAIGRGILQVSGIKPYPPFQPVVPVESS